jgi:hypothetical protein
MLRCGTAGVLAAMVASASAAPPGEYAGINPKDLQATPISSTVELAERLAWNRISKKTELGLLPDKYTVSWQDAEGRFFLAAAPAFYMRTVRGQYLLARGGVLLPHDRTAKPRFFFVQDDQVKSGKTLEEAIAHVPAGPAFVPLIDALLNWATRGYLVVLAEVDDDALNEKLRATFAAP